MALPQFLSRLMEIPGVYELWQAPFANKKIGPFLYHASIPPNCRVLDVGCGPGTNAELFLNRKCHYTGIDINPEYIRQAASNFPGGDFRVRDLAAGEIEDLGKFDLIFINSVLHHIPPKITNRLLENLSRLLTGGGAIHILELVLPKRIFTPSGLLARLDRGEFPLPADEWRQIFSQHYRTEVEQLYAIGLGPVPLWEMIYFKGRI